MKFARRGAMLMEAALGALPKTAPQPDVDEPIPGSVPKRKIRPLTKRQLEAQEAERLQAEKKELERKLRADRYAQNVEMLKAEIDVPESIEDCRNLQEGFGMTTFEAMRSQLQNSSLNIDLLFQIARLQAAALLNVQPERVSERDVCAVALWIGIFRDPSLKISLEYPGFMAYRERILEENDPKFDETGQVIPSEIPVGCGSIYLKGVGPMIVPEIAAKFEREIQDRWAVDRWEKVHKVDRRSNPMGIEGLSQMGTLTKILAFAQKVLRSAIEARRPAEEDVDYAFLSKAEKPFAGTEAIITPEMENEVQYDLPLAAAVCLNNVFPGHRLKPVSLRRNLHTQWLKPLAAAKGWYPWIDWKQQETDNAEKYANSS